MDLTKRLDRIKNYAERLKTAEGEEVAELEMLLDHNLLQLVNSLPLYLRRPSAVTNIDELTILWTKS